LILWWPLCPHFCSLWTQLPVVLFHSRRLHYHIKTLTKKILRLEGVPVKEIQNPYGMLLLYEEEQTTRKEMWFWILIICSYFFFLLFFWLVRWRPRKEGVGEAKVVGELCPTKEWFLFCFGFCFCFCSSSCLLSFVLAVL
jgi:hypothetical protein